MSQSQALASSSKVVIDGSNSSTNKRGPTDALQVGDQQEDALATQDIEEADEGDSCLICLGEIIDQSVLPKCLHSLFCFDCIIKWISIHRRCPLCSTSIEGYIIHSIRSDDDYIRHYLPKIGSESDKDSHDIAVDPLRLQADLSQTEARRIRRQLQQRITRDQPGTGQNSRVNRFNRATASSKPEWGEVRVEERQRDAIAHWDQRLAFRRRVYREELYCFHIGSNSTSKLTSPSSHSIISSTPLIESTLLSFIRRELLAYPLTIDVDFLSRYTIHIFKSFDCRSNEAIDLMAEFLGTRGSSHFCHEVYTFSRFIGQASARQRDKVKAFDEWAQYRPIIARQTAEHRGSSQKDIPQAQDSISTPAKESREASTSDTRQLVIKGREKLLQRLEEDKRRLTSNGNKEGGHGSSESGGDTSLDREKTKKNKLLLQRKEVLLRSRALEGRAKRLKT